MDDVEALMERIKTDRAGGKTDEEIFQYLLPRIERDPKAGGRLAESLVALPDPLTVKLLHRMLGTIPDKNVRKVIKRSLYRLRSKGVAVGEISSGQERSILRPLQAESREGFASGIDFMGYRVLWLIVSRPGRGVGVMHGVVSDREGIVDFSQEEMSRKEFRTFFKEIRDKNPFPIVEIEPSYVAYLFARAYQSNVEKKGPSPQSYLQAKSEIEKIRKDYAKPLIYSYPLADDLAGDDRLSRKGGDLLNVDVFSSWRIEEEQIRPYAEEIREAEESKIVLHPGQKEMRFQGIYQKALAELFSGQERLLYQRRLEEMAYVLFKLGKEEEAKISLSVAMDLEKPLNPIQPSPFLFQLVTKSIFSLLTEAKEKKSKEVSLIVKP